MNGITKLCQSNFLNSQFNSLLLLRIQNSNGLDLTKEKYKYSSEGNLTEINYPQSNIPTTYLWGYKHQYLIAKIENATYESVRTALGYSNDSQVETLAGKDEPSTSEWTTINTLRTQLPNAMVTTYTYKPLVGVKSIVDPGYKTTTYEYDAFGRLQAIRDHNEKLIEQYDYHYKD